MGTLKCVCVSKERKTSARSVRQCRADKDGLVGDIHYGFDKKQVSLLPYDRVKAYFDETGSEICYGRFGENLVAEGIEWAGIHLGDRFCCGDVVLEVVKTGAGGPASDAYKGKKVCSPMEPDFVFCRVLQGGILAEGQKIKKISGEENR